MYLCALRLFRCEYPISMIMFLIAGATSASMESGWLYDWALAALNLMLRICLRCITRGYTALDSVAYACV